ncbi:GNAT family N-acetyltransferase [Microbacterium indicum]|uniref:GNAT family N-acetyltransferase n=1 Tax=Microbacterium indicum TaxID=358100 RepID=UPI0003FC4F14|nr:GNAT family N-acetyltransferase [Microbacterium indicum]
MDMTVEDAPESRRFELRRGDELLSVLDYRISGDVISFTRAFTNPAHRGHGYAAVVTEGAVDDAERRGLRVVPMCWYVAQWFEEHPERGALIAA